MVESVSGALSDTWSGWDSWVVFASGETASFCGDVVSGVGVASGVVEDSGVVDDGAVSVLPSPAVRSAVESSLPEGASSVDGEVLEGPLGWVSGVV